jgi:hypothetical protein
MGVRALIPETVKPFGRRVFAELDYWSNTARVRDDPLSASVGRLCGEWRSILARSQDSLGPKDGKRILFFTGNGLNASALSIETLLMTSLRMRGHDCRSLICDRGLPSCEFNRTGVGDPPAGKFSRAFTRRAASSMCNACSAAASAAMAATGTETHALHEFGEPGDYAEAQAIVDSVDPGDIRDFTYREVSVGDHAYSSTLRQTLRGTVELTNPEELWTYRRQLLSTIVMVDRFSRCLDVLQPDTVVLVHGVYLTHGTAAEICGKRGIDVVVYGVPYRKGTIWLSHRETYHRSLVSEATDLWENLELSPEMSECLDDYLASKTAGGRDNVNYHPDPIVDRAPIVKELGLDAGATVISLFTNVVWDAQIYYRHNAFEDIFDWLYSTIEYFESRKPLQLVIRIHPAETKGGFMTRQPLMADLRRRFPVLPSNVFVIPSESAISSYTVAEMSSAALIYGTKMGLEIALRGIPVVVAGETFNRGKGFTYDVETREEYFSLLDRIEALPRNNEQMVERARKFAYYLFFMRMIDMPLLSTDLHQVLRPAGERFFTFDSLDALLPGRSRNLDMICDGIVHGAPFVAAPTREFALPLAGKAG